MNFKPIIYSTLLFTLSSTVLAQRHCGSSDFMSKFPKRELSTNENLSHKTNATYIIPVVVHVIYNSPIENISDEQIESQISALNRDFSLSNLDALVDPHAFFSVQGDPDIQFGLAHTDPDGLTTSGITRTPTDSADFKTYSTMKYAASGGTDAWDRDKYLNIWVCDIGLKLLGFATSPTYSFLPEEDGVVINYQTFGTLGTAQAPFDGGRTAVHEIGHWLDLFHIWGDEFCGNDFISDTPPQESENTDCPTFPHNAFNSCGGNASGEMFMNYMDYTNDDCMVMFTAKQSNKMRSTMANFRSVLASSTTYNFPVSIVRLEDNTIHLFPQPALDILSVQSNFSINASLRLFDTMGKEVLSGSINGTLSQVDIHQLKNGIYILNINSPDGVINKKVIIR